MQVVYVHMYIRSVKLVSNTYVRTHTPKFIQYPPGLRMEYILSK